MAESPESGRPYRVDCSVVMAVRFRKLQQEAKQRGNGDMFLSAMKEIGQRLQNDPLEAGEPLYRLPALRLRIRSIAVRPLVVDYAVSEDQPLVFIKGVRLLSDK